MGKISDCFCKGAEFAQSHRPEEANPGSYDKCEPGFMALIIDSMGNNPSGQCVSISCMWKSGSYMVAEPVLGWFLDM